MKYNPEIHHRHSLRLKNYDYSKSGNYFVTIVPALLKFLVMCKIKHTINLLFEGIPCRDGGFLRRIDGGGRVYQN